MDIMLSGNIFSPRFRAGRITEHPLLHIYNVWKRLGVGFIQRWVEIFEPYLCVLGGNNWHSESGRRDGNICTTNGKWKSIASL